MTQENKKENQNPFNDYKAIFAEAAEKGNIDEVYKSFLSKLETKLKESPQSAPEIKTVMDDLNREYKAAKSEQKSEDSSNEIPAPSPVEALQYEIYSLQYSLRRLTSEMSKVKDKQQIFPVYGKRRFLLGKYPYDMEGTVKPLEWVVLDEEVDGTLLILSKNCIDYANYVYAKKQGPDMLHRNIHYYWGGSSIRAWLNTYFYNTAFSEQEKQGIIQTPFIDVGLDRKIRIEHDHIFLLSSTQLDRYLSADMAVPEAKDENRSLRKSYPTPYVTLKAARDVLKSDAAQYYMLSDKIYDNGGDFFIKIDSTRLASNYPVRVALRYKKAK